MACINKSSKLFKEALLKYKVSPDELSVRLHKFLNVTNTQLGSLKDPSAVYDFLDKEFQITSSNIYTSKKAYKEAATVYETLKKKCAFSLKRDAEQMYQTMSEIFGEENVTIVQRAKGDFAVLVGKPIFEKSEQHRSTLVDKIISGGLTGVDTIGLQVAKKLGIETGGTAPKNFQRESGIDDEDISSYGLVEITDALQQEHTKKTGKKDPYTGRTALNVANSDGTVYFYTDKDLLGYRATKKAASEYNKPFIENPTAELLRLWIIDNNIRTLNVAGNRGSKLSKDNNISSILELALKPTKIQDTTNYLEESKKLVEKMIQDSKASVKRSDNFAKDHTYLVKLKDGTWKAADMSVTEFVHGKRDLGKWGIAASSFGNAVDIATREFFKGLDIRKMNIPNLTKEAKIQLYQDLNNLKKAFDLKFGVGQYNVVTEEFPIVGKIKLNGEFKTIVGTMDMLIYDSKGNFYIYDMKTTRINSDNAEANWEKKLPGYSKLQYIYKNILQANYTELKGRIKETKLIRFDVKYPSVTEVDYTFAKDGVTLLADGIPFTDLEFGNDYLNPMLHTQDGSVTDLTLVETVPVDKEIIKKQELTEAELEILKEEFSMDKVGEHKETPKVNVSEVSSLWETLHNSATLSHTQSLFVANSVMKLASRLISDILEGNNLEDFTEDTEVVPHLVGEDRQTIISTLGIHKILNYVKEFWFNPEYVEDDGTEEVQNLLKLLKEIYDNFEAIKRLGNNKLILLEGITLGTINPNEIQTEAISELLEAENNFGALEESTREHYQLGQRLISAKSSLSKEIRKLFEMLPIVNDEGEQILDDDFGIPKYVDANEAINDIFVWCNACETISEMKEILESKQEDSPWVSSILEAIKEEPIRSQFFNNFRKDWTQYSIVLREYDKKSHSYSFKIHVINSNSAKDVILREVLSAYHDGLLTDIVKNPSIDGEGIISTDFIKKQAPILLSLKKEVEKGSRSTGYTVNTTKLLKAINAFGLPINEEQLNTIIKVDKKGAKNLARNAQFSVTGKIINNLLELNESLLALADLLDTNADEIPVFNPLSKGNNILSNIYKNYANLAGLFAPAIHDSVESSAYLNGKMYYSYVTPSAMGRIIKNLKGALGNDTKRNDYIEENYGLYEFFKDGETGKWLCPWLADGSLKDMIDHKVQLAFNGTGYTDLSELNYTLSIMTEFYSNLKSTGDTTYAWYRVPMMSNKPSSEFIKGKRYLGLNAKRNIAGLMRLVFEQEVRRMRTVLDAAANSKNEPVKNFDISKKARNNAENKAILEKFKKGTPLTWDDLVSVDKFGKKQLRFSNPSSPSGASFKFLDAFNLEIIDNTAFGLEIIKMLNGIEPNTRIIDNAFKPKGALYNAFDKICAKTFAQWEELGMFDIESKEVKTNKGKTTKLYFFTNINLFIPASVWKITKKALIEEGYEGEAFEKALKSKMIELAKLEFERFIWNDTLASINIIELTTTDLAYYKNVEDFLKRYALLHSPSMRLNEEAKDINGIPYASDKYARTLYLKDWEVQSEIKANVETVFNKKIAAEKSPSKIKELEIMKNIILSGFDKVNVTDALGYSSMTSYRKKLGMLGKWDTEMEKAFARIQLGDFNIEDLNIVWLPLKPFVYTKTKKSTNSSIIPSMPMPIQNKNSEFLLLIANAVIRSDKEIARKSKLTALFDYMEDTAYTGRTRVVNGYEYTDGIKGKKSRKPNGTIINHGTYNGRGIDTVQFESAVKVGLMGVVNINELEYGDAIEKLYNVTYADDAYDLDYVHEYEWADYGILQEVPAHLYGELLMGSQIRILSLSDVTSPNAVFNTEDLTKEDGSEITVLEAINECKQLIAENIYDSYLILKDTLDLGDTTGMTNKQIRMLRNQKLSELLLEEMMKDARYDEDLKFACEINPETGEFNLPLCDPILATRILQLLNSIIKRRINKQTVPGGPVVQTSVYGFSEDLNVIYKDINGNRLDTFSEFKLKHPKISNDKIYSAYLKYCDLNQALLDYYEALLPIPNEELRQALTKPDGSIMTVEEAKTAGIVTDEMLKAICYRIPTEDKYSMMPIKIVGFLPSAQLVVVLPKDITLLTGSDFDIDKMYIMLKPIKRTVIDTKQLLSDVRAALLYPKSKKDNAKELVYMLRDMLNSNMTLEEALLLVDDKLAQFVKENPSKYINKFSIGDSKRDLRNARIFDILYALLKHSMTMDKMFNPGSFDVLKKTARIITILKQEGNTKTYAELRKIADQPDGLDLLDALIDSGEAKNICHITTLVEFHKLNMTAGKLIGIFANNNTSHAFLLSLAISLKFGADGGFTFNGITVDNNNNNMLDNIYALDGITLISKNIAGFLAASVDAVKDPVLNFMNLNTCTAAVAMVLTRLGFNSDSVGLFLSLPVIVELARRWTDANNKGFATASSIALLMLKERTNNDTALLKSKLKTLKNTAFSTKQLAEGLTNRDADFELDVLLLFDKLAEIGSHLGTLTFLTKFNSSTNAVGPNIADTMVMELKYNKFLSLMKSDKAPFSGNASYVIENDPILKAFYDTTVGPKGASREIFTPYFPHYSKSFTNILEAYLETCKGNLTADDINKLMNYYLLYIMSSGENKVLDGSKEARDYFINKFPEEFLEEKDIIKDYNKLVSIIKTRPRDLKVPVVQLEAKMGNYSIDIQEEIKASWTDMMRDKSLDKVFEMGEKLFLYNLYRNGVNFSPKTFNHLSSVMVKQLIKDGNYIAKLTESIDYDMYEGEIYNLLTLYRRNNSTDSKAVLPIALDNKAVSIKGKKLTYDLSLEKDMSDIIISSREGMYIIAPMILVNDKLYQTSTIGVDSNSSIAIYEEISPLGVKNNFIEVNGEEASEMVSVLNEPAEGEDDTEPKLDAPEDNNVAYSFTGELSKILAKAYGAILLANPKLAEKIVQGINNENMTISEKAISIISKFFETYTPTSKKNERTKDKIINCIKEIC